MPRDPVNFLAKVKSKEEKEKEAFALQKMKLIQGLNANLNQNFKTLFMQLVQKSESNEAIKMLAHAPFNSLFNEFKSFKFQTQFVTSDGKKKLASISPLALAVLMGDMKLFDFIINYMRDIEVDFGYELQDMDGERQLQSVSPLQIACSLGLFKTVKKLLQHGADPN